MNSMLMLHYLLYMHLGIEPTYNEHPTPHCFIMRSEARLAAFNRACAHDGVTADEVQEISKNYGATPFSWFVYETQQEVQEILENQGFSHLDSFPVMSMNLFTPKSQEWAPEIDIKKIDHQNLDLFISIVAKNYRVQGKEVEFAQFARYLIEHTPATHYAFYIGYYQGIPAATSMSIQHEDTLVLHWVSTLPEYRGKGLGFAINHKALADAQAQGCSRAILIASSMGKPVYEKIGFKEYARCKVYGKKTN